MGTVGYGTGFRYTTVQGGGKAQQDPATRYLATSWVLTLSAYLHGVEVLAAALRSWHVQMCAIMHLRTSIGSLCIHDCK